MSVAGAGGKGKCWHTLGGISVGFLLCTIAGIVVLSVGLSQQAAVSAFDATKDFMAVDGGCTVETIKHDADQRNDKTPFCVDVRRPVHPAHHLLTGITGLSLASYRRDQTPLHVHACPRPAPFLAGLHLQF